jgi:hypothetical protein
MSINPLTQYFRQPAIYVKLPSNGEHYTAGSLNMPVNRELPVYPMTAIDEITYRTPDALFNGNAVVNVIKSCMPNIVDPWAVPAMDVDTILVAIRIASYGHTMEVSTTCPHCKNEDDYGMDLRIMLERMKAPDYSTPVAAGDLEIFFKPMTYKNLNDNNQRQFEEQKVLSILPDSDVAEEEKLRLLNQTIMKLTRYTVIAAAQCIAMIKTPQAMVSEQPWIQEFLANCESHVFNQIKDHLVALRESTDIPPLQLDCPECKHRYDQTFTLDQSNFFAPAS